MTDKIERLDFDMNFYVLKLVNGESFISVREDECGDLYGFLGLVYTWVSQSEIESVISSTPKEY